MSIYFDTSKIILRSSQSTNYPTASGRRGIQLLEIKKAGIAHVDSFTPPKVKLSHS